MALTIRVYTKAFTVKGWLNITRRMGLKHQHKRLWSVVNTQSRRRKCDPILDKRKYKGRRWLFCLHTQTKQHSLNLNILQGEFSFEIRMKETW